MEEKYKCSWCGCEEVVYGVDVYKRQIHAKTPGGMVVCEQ